MIKSYDVQVISNLIRYAEKHKQKKRFTLVAAIAKKGKVLFLGTNSYTKTSPLTHQTEGEDVVITRHAEIDVLKQLESARLKDRRGLTLYVTGLSKAGKPTLINNSCPCEGCSKVIGQMEMQRLVYSKALNGNFEIIESLI